MKNNLRMWIEIIQFIFWKSGIVISNILNDSIKICVYLNLNSDLNLISNLWYKNFILNPYAFITAFIAPFQNKIQLYIFVKIIFLFYLYFKLYFGCYA